MSDSQELVVSFTGISAAQSDSLAKDLEQELRREGLIVHLEQPDKTRQDFGATIVLVLGAPAVVIAAKALRDWANRKNVGTIIKKRNGDVVVTGLESKDVAAVADKISSAVKD